MLKWRIKDANLARSLVGFALCWLMVMALPAWAASPTWPQYWAHLPEASAERALLDEAFAAYGKEALKAELAQKAEQVLRPMLQASAIARAGKPNEDERTRQEALKEGRAWMFLGELMAAQPSSTQLVYEAERQGLKLLEHHLAGDDMELAHHLSRHANALRMLSRHDEAIELQKRALVISKKAVGLEHPGTGTRLNNLASLYQDMGRFEQALPLYQRALAISEKAEGPEHPNTGTRLNNLASLHQDMGRYEQALPLYQRALAISEKAEGPEHPGTGASLNNLALLYKAMGRYEQALPLFQRALAISEKAAGPEHPGTGTCLSNLAALYQDIGRYEQALPLSQRALAISVKAEGAEHLKTGVRLNNLALLYRAMGRYEQALPLFQRALAIIEKAAGPEHPSTGTSLNNLGTLYQDMGRYERALTLKLRALAISEKAEGGEHPNTGARLNNLAMLYQVMGRYEQALPLFQRALAISKKAEGPEHPNTGTRLNNLAMLYLAMGRYEQALPLLQRALVISEKAEGPEHPNSGTSLNNLALLYHDVGSYEQALPLLQRALVISEKAEGPEHPNTGNRLNNLATLYQDMGRFEQALPLYQRTLAISETAEGFGHPSTGACLNNLASLFIKMGRYEQALPLYVRAFSVAARTSMPELTWHVSRNLMRAHAQTSEQVGATSFYQPDLAIWFGKQAIQSIQGVRGHMQSLDKGLQKSFLQKHQDTYQFLASLLIDAGRLAEAEQVLALLKERELTETVRYSAVSSQLSTVDDVGVERVASERLAQLQKQGRKDAAELTALETRIKQGAELSAEEEARRQALIAAAEVWRADFQRFIDGLDELFKQNKTQLANEAQLSTNTRLQAKVALDPTGAVGLHYVVTEDHVSIIVATPQGSFGRRSDIKSAELYRQIGALRQAIVKKADTLKPAQALWHALIAPVWADVQAAGAKTLVLSLTDKLRYVPFGALQNPKGRYLVQDVALSMLAQAADSTPAPSAQAWQVSALGLTQAREGRSALPGVEYELKGIVRTKVSPDGVLPGRIALDAQFTLHQLQLALNGWGNVVHIASHFDFKPGDESRSVLLLGEGEPVSLGKLAGMDFSKVEQLTLSACDTAMGGGVNENGVEVESLAALALRAQAKSVLATLWQVADESTAQLMQDFYRQRAQPEPPSRAQALRAAQVAMIEGRFTSGQQGHQATTRGGRLAAPPDEGVVGAADPSRPYAHPYYWAPFVLSGSWL